jgi:hypothetical protein
MPTLPISIISTQQVRADALLLDRRSVGYAERNRTVFNHLTKNQHNLNGLLSYLPRIGCIRKLYH